MSRALHVLLRLQRETVESLQIALARVTEERAELARQNLSQILEIKQEQGAAQQSPPAQSPYGAYAIRNVQLSHVRAARDAVLAQDENGLRGDLTAAFVELKKFETLLEQQALRERVATNAAEMAALDESAIAISARRMRGG